MNQIPIFLFFFSRFDEWIPESQLARPEMSDRSTKSASSSAPPITATVLSNTITTNDTSSSFRRMASDNMVGSPRHPDETEEVSSKQRSIMMANQDASSVDNDPNDSLPSHQHASPTDPRPTVSHSARSHMIRRSSINSLGMTDSQFESSTKKTRRSAGKSNPAMASDIVDHGVSSSSGIAMFPSSSSKLPLTGTTSGGEPLRLSRPRWDAVSDTGSSVEDDATNRSTKVTPSAASSFHDDQSISDSNMSALSVALKAKNSTTLHNNSSVSSSRASGESPMALSAKSVSFPNSGGSRRARHYYRKHGERIKEFRILLSDYKPLESFDGMSIMDMEYRLRYLHERYHLLADEVDRATRQLSRRSHAVVTRSSNSMVAASALFSVSSSSSSSSLAVSTTSMVSNNQSRPMPKRQPLFATL
jgi:hypothetical protein